MKPQKVFNEISAKGEFIGQRPAAGEMEAFRKILEELEPLAKRVRENDEDMVEEFLDYQDIYKTLFLEFSSPWFQWDRGSLQQQEYAITKYGRDAILKAWSKPLPTQAEQQ